MQTPLEIHMLLLIGALVGAGSPHAGQVPTNGSPLAREDDTSFARYRRVAAQHRLAAERGSAIGMCNLGDMFMAGHGVERSAAEAYRWYLAALQATTPGRGSGSVAVSRLTSEQRKTCNRSRKTAASALNPGERAEAERVARTWLRTVVSASIP